MNKTINNPSCHETYILRRGNRPFKKLNEIYYTLDGDKCYRKKIKKRRQLGCAKSYITFLNSIVRESITENRVFQWRPEGGARVSPAIEKRVSWAVRTKAPRKDGAPGCSWSRVSEKQRKQPRWGLGMGCRQCRASGALQRVWLLIQVRWEVPGGFCQRQWLGLPYVLTGLFWLCYRE